ncbi:hypothetical protein EAG18_04620 [Pseudoalteromonas sp. J010]|uniref:DUF6942 family protein n=1 Tax=Pseudoalteromonas sp. J010 TaxID=998465 RepID=UPI000F650DD3|nr:hypothetical protein [Pseudoalteromonas sp. J010]RRS09851.1 hypothetical protein EAG18_04620 [Pseudoalteromonas sp. J010]
MDTTQNKKILTRGFGAKTGHVAFYIEHPPAILSYKNISKIIPLEGGEIDYINNQCGNGWRKIFNVFAKFLFAAQLPDHNITNFPSWQSYRDSALLQASSQEALLFSPPDFSIKSYNWHIIAGRTYAKSLLKDQIFTNSLIWLDDEFAVDTELNLIVSPFLDYRQLSNIKINRLANIIKGN